MSEITFKNHRTPLIPNSLYAVSIAKFDIPSKRGNRKIYAVKEDASGNPVFLTPPSAAVYPGTKGMRPAMFFMKGDFVYVAHRELYSKSAFLGRVIEVDNYKQTLSCQFFRPLADDLASKKQTGPVVQYLATPLVFQAPLSYVVSQHVDADNFNIVGSWEEKSENPEINSFDPRDDLAPTTVPHYRDPKIGLVTTTKTRREQERIHAADANSYLNTVVFLVDSLFEGASISAALRGKLGKIVDHISSKLKETERIEYASSGEDEEEIQPKKKRKKEIIETEPAIINARMDPNDPDLESLMNDLEDDKLFPTDKEYDPKYAVIPTRSEKSRRLQYLLEEKLRMIHTIYQLANECECGPCASNPDVDEICHKCTSHSMYVHDTPEDVRKALISLEKQKRFLIEALYELNEIIE